MRRYAPHHTHVQSWSGSTRAYTQSQRALSSLRNAISQLFTSPIISNPSPLSTSIPISSSHDDVHAEARLAALRRWLDMSAPLSPSAKAALCMLMRPKATIVRMNHSRVSTSFPAYPTCRLCATQLGSSNNNQSSNLLTPNNSDNNTNDINNNDNNVRQSIIWTLFVDVFWKIVSIGLFWFLHIVLRFLRKLGGIQSRFHHTTAIKATKTALEDVMTTAPYYSSWYAAASRLDEIDGNHIWKSGSDAASIPFHGLCESCDTQWNAKSRIRKRAKAAKEVVTKIDAVCNVDMLAAKLRELAVLYNTGDVKGLAFSLRASLVRNLGGMCHPELHVHSRVGTNHIVEDYVNVVSYLLAYIAEIGLDHLYDNPSDQNHVSTSGQSSLSELKNETDERVEYDNERTNSYSSLSKGLDGGMSFDDKLTFLNEARHAFGRTGLMLSGGASMGLNHLGVVKGLLDQGLLPKVVCGTSAGALVASMVGIFDDAELRSIFSETKLLHPTTKQSFSFRYFDNHTTIFGSLRRFIRKGFIQDIKMLQDCLRKNYGDLTFEEAYTKTHRILNITACPSRSSSDPPLLLNYLTAPHVLIWSAAAASCALPLVFAPVELFAKSANDRIVTYHPDGVRWIDGSISSDVPLSRIGELFNVNHFVVSQTNPHVIPRSMPIMHTRIALLLKSELQFRYWQLLQMGLVPKILTAIFPHFMQPYAGDVTIMPDVRLSDLSKLLRNPTEEEVNEFVRRGELQTFPFLDRIRLHCLIEQTLDIAVEHVATIAKGQESKYASSSRKGKTLFGRVPSWLWLDARSILASGPMSAVAARVSASIGNDGNIEDSSSNVKTKDEKDKPEAKEPSGILSLTKHVKRTLSSSGSNVPKLDAIEETSKNDQSKVVYQDLDDILNQLERDETSDSLRVDSRQRHSSSGSIGSEDLSEEEEEEDRVLC